MLQEDYTAGCITPSAETVAFYAPCTLTGQCPRGSVCKDDGGDHGPTCLPLCLFEDPVFGGCPGEGLCWTALQGTDLHLCTLFDDCTPYPDSCPLDLACYRTADPEANICAEPGQTALGEACAEHTDCLPESGCHEAVPGSGDLRCFHYCDLAEGTGCPTGDCTDLGVLVMGVCLP